MDLRNCTSCQAPLGIPTSTSLNSHLRLWICGIAVAIAMFGLLWDFLYPFPLSRPVLILCSGSYFLLMGVLTLYTTYKEKVESPFVSNVTSLSNGLRWINSLMRNSESQGSRISGNLLRGHAKGSCWPGS